MSSVVSLENAKRVRRAHRGSGGGSARGDDNRPLIRIGAELHKNVDEASAALEADPETYQRDATLVTVLRTTEADEDDLSSSGTPQIRALSHATLRERLSRFARWEKLDRRSDDWIACLPSEPVVQALAARGAWTGIRPLVGVIECPTLRSDGSVLEQPGYDERTGYLYLPSEVFPPVPDLPTADDARRAVVELEEPLADFPFKSPAHRSAVLAALLTLVARPAIRGSVPGFIFDANTRGSGKTLLADFVALVATGRAAARMTWPADDVELEKILGAYALRAAALICFDNLTRPFGGGPLDRVLTADDFVELRVLGKSEVPALRWRSVVLASGNNVDILGDTSRRVLLARLESELENPEERRGFQIQDLRAWVREQRPRLVSAALTILRAFCAAGRPRGDDRNWGSFEAWAALVPAALVFAGAANPLDARPVAEGREDQEKQALTALLAGWARLDPGEGLSAKSAIELLYPLDRLRGQAAPDGFDDLREAIESLVGALPGRPPSPQKLSYQLRRLRRRVVGGRMVDATNDRTGLARWRVVEGPSARTQVAEGRSTAEDADDADHVSNPSRGNWQ